MRRTWMPIIGALGAALLWAGAAGADGVSSTVRVVNAHDAGPGSFRAAVARASADASVRRIEFRAGLQPIALQAPVVFGGAQSLEIAGSGARLDGSALPSDAAAALLVNGGGNLAISRIAVRNAPQHGLTYQVPGGASGVKRVTLTGVEVTGNDGHGVLVNDQVDPDDVANDGGSAASLEVTVIGSQFTDNGFGALDRDGIRINEGGEGGLRLTMALSRAEHNGADGIELDERGLGDATFSVASTLIVRNGSFDVTQADLDDGMDVDESGDGALVGTVVASAANDNFEEGWDFNENHAGDFKVDLIGVEASRNLEEGIDFEEDDDFQGGGDLITAIVGVKADGNGPGGDAGLKIRERGDGNIDASVRLAQTAGNLTGGVNLREQGNGDLAAQIARVTATGNGTAGIAIREDDLGSLAATVERSTTDGNTGHGVDCDENADGTLTATVRNGSSSTNGGAGVRADQQAPGATGTLALTAMTLDGNTGGPYLANAGVTVTQTP
ncbi:MAG: hypothetical protein ACKVUT_15665 [Gaiella sp.]